MKINEVTGDVSDGNFIIRKNGERERVYTTYKILVTVNDEYLFMGYSNERNKKDALKYTVNCFNFFYNQIPQKDSDDDLSFKMKITIKKVKDKREGLDFKFKLASLV